MNPARIAIVVVALVAAVVLALVVHSLFGAKPPQQQVAAAAPPPVQMTRVLVAKGALPVGQRLSADNMAWQPWPSATLNAAYITDGAVAANQNLALATVNKAGAVVADMASGGGPKMKALEGAIVREEIFDGEPITDKKIVRSGDTSYMAVRLPEGMRAISLPINTESGAGGFVQPGDHVDLIATHPDSSRNGSGGIVTETVLSNAVVLAVDQRTDMPKTGQAAVAGATVTLAVPAETAGAVAHVRALGTSGLTLALRSYADIGGHVDDSQAVDTHAVRVFRGGGPAEMVTAQ